MQHTGRGRVTDGASGSAKHFGRHDGRDVEVMEEVHHVRAVEERKRSLKVTQGPSGIEDTADDTVDSGAKSEDEGEKVGEVCDDAEVQSKCKETRSWHLFQEETQYEIIGRVVDEGKQRGKQKHVSRSWRQASGFPCEAEIRIHRSTNVDLRRRRSGRWSWREEPRRENIMDCMCM